MVALNQIGQIAITVRDLPRAVNFYRDVLGMRHLFDAGPKLSFFDCGGVRLMLDVPEQARVPASAIDPLLQGRRHRRRAPRAQGRRACASRTSRT